MQVQAHHAMDPCVRLKQVVEEGLAVSQEEVDEGRAGRTPRHIGRRPWGQLQGRARPTRATSTATNQVTVGGHRPNGVVEAGRVALRRPRDGKRRATRRVAAAQGAHGDRRQLLDQLHLNAIILRAAKARQRLAQKQGPECGAATRAVRWETSRSACTAARAPRATSSPSVPYGATRLVRGRINAPTEWRAARTAWRMPPMRHVAWAGVATSDKTANSGPANEPRNDMALGGADGC